MNKIITLSPPEGVEVSSDRIGDLWVLPEGIIVGVNNEIDHHGIREAVESVEAVRKIAGNIRMPILVDGSNVKSMSREARTYFNLQADEVITAMAILSNSYLGRMVANFFIGFSKTTIPTRMFNDYEEALTWLRKYKLKQNMEVKAPGVASEKAKAYQE